MEQKKEIEPYQVIECYGYVSIVIINFAGFIASLVFHNSNMMAVTMSLSVLIYLLTLIARFI
jgi:hypothetical protein